MLLNEIVRKKAVDEAEVSPFDPAKNTHTVGGAAHKHGPFDVGQEGSWVPGSDTGDPRNQKHSQDFNNKLDAHPELKRAYYNLTPKQAMNIGYRGLTRGVLNYKTTPGTTAGPFGTDVVPHKPAGAEDNVPFGRSSNPFRTPGTSTSQHNITGDPAIGTSGPMAPGQSTAAAAAQGNAATAASTAASQAAAQQVVPAPVPPGEETQPKPVLVPTIADIKDKAQVRIEVPVVVPVPDKEPYRIPGHETGMAGSGAPNVAREVDPNAMPAKAEHMARIEDERKKTEEAAFKALQAAGWDEDRQARQQAMIIAREHAAKLIKQARQNELADAKLIALNRKVVITNAIAKLDNQRFDDDPVGTDLPPAVSGDTQPADDTPWSDDGYKPIGDIIGGSGYQHDDSGVQDTTLATGVQHDDSGVEDTPWSDDGYKPIGDLEGEHGKIDPLPGPRQTSWQGGVSMNVADYGIPINLQPAAQKILDQMEKDGVSQANIQATLDKWVASQVPPGGSGYQHDDSGAEDTPGTQGQGGVSQQGVFTMPGASGYQHDDSGAEDTPGTQGQGGVSMDVEDYGIPINLQSAAQKILDQMETGGLTQANIQNALDKWVASQVPPGGSGYQHDDSGAEDTPGKQGKGGISMSAEYQKALDALPIDRRAAADKIITQMENDGVSQAGIQEHIIGWMTSTTLTPDDHPTLKELRRTVATRELMLQGIPRDLATKLADQAIQAGIETETFIQQQIKYHDELFKTRENAGVGNAMKEKAAFMQLIDDVYIGVDDGVRIPDGTKISEAIGMDDDGKSIQIGSTDNLFLQKEITKQLVILNDMEAKNFVGVKTAEELEEGMSTWGKVGIALAIAAGIITIGPFIGGGTAISATAAAIWKAIAITAGLLGLSRVASAAEDAMGDPVITDIPNETFDYDYDAMTLADINAEIDRVNDSMQTPGITGAIRKELEDRLIILKKYRKLKRRDRSNESLDRANKARSLRSNELLDKVSRARQLRG